MTQDANYSQKQLERFGWSGNAKLSVRLPGRAEKGVVAADSVALDAAPRPLYVRRNVENADEVLRWAKAQGISPTLAADDLHVTIAYSRQPVDWMKVGQAWHSKMELPEGGPRVMEQFGEALVLSFASDELQWRHESILNAGASWDHPQYQPHITIGYDTGKSPEEVEPYRGRIVLGPEIFEDIDEGWKERAK